jgi:FixJ family two-component response regulator
MTTTDEKVQSAIRIGAGKSTVESNPIWSTSAVAPLVHNRSHRANRNVRHSQSHVPPQGEPIVYIVDDDPLIREAVSSLLRSVDLEVRLFGSALELLQSELEDTPSCLILDIRLPRLSGLDLQVELAAANIHIPIIFLTGHGDIPMTVKAMKAGAVDFLTKPFRPQEMIDAVAAALERDRKRHGEEKSNSDVQARFASLTSRQRQIMALVSDGLMNKQIAAQLGISEMTVKIHRGHVMRKMCVRSLAELVVTAESHGIRGQEK